MSRGHNVCQIGGWPVFGCAVRVAIEGAVSRMLRCGSRRSSCNTKVH